MCLLGYSASWATFASRATLPLRLLLPLGLYIDTLPLRLYLIDTVCFDNAGILLCLLGYFASWAALPLGLLCLLGYFASWATLPLGHYIDTLPLRLCLIDIVCFDNAGILICLLGCANTGHLLVCKDDKTC
jgi:uncharacterized membrane protein YphA (DoxX/SURF4 family)